MKRLIPLKLLMEMKAEDFAIAGNVSAFELDLARLVPGNEKRLGEILDQLTESGVGNGAKRADIVAGIHIGLTLASLKFINDELEGKADQKTNDLLMMEVKTTWKQ